MGRFQIYFEHRKKKLDGLIVESDEESRMWGWSWLELKEIIGRWRQRSKVQFNLPVRHPTRDFIALEYTSLEFKVYV